MLGSLPHEGQGELSVGDRQRPGVAPGLGGFLRAFRAMPRRIPDRDAEPVRVDRCGEFEVVSAKNRPDVVVFSGVGDEPWKEPLLLLQRLDVGRLQLIEQRKVKAKGGDPTRRGILIDPEQVAFQDGKQASRSDRVVRLLVVPRPLFCQAVEKPNQENAGAASRVDEPLISSLPSPLRAMSSTISARNRGV